MPPQCNSNPLLLWETLKLLNINGLFLWVAARMYRVL